MLTMDQAREVIGATAYTRDGERIGRIGQLYLDDATGQPEWITVSTGFFGTRESFVPLVEAEVDGERVLVPYTKDRVKGAPHVDAEEGHLSVVEEAELYRYYGLPETGPFAGMPGELGESEPMPDDATPPAGYAAGTSGTVEDAAAAGPDVGGRHRLRRFSTGEGDETVS